MDIWLHGITTAVPDRAYTQKESAAGIAKWITSDQDRRLSRVAHKASGIEQRHSVLPDLEEGFFQSDASGGVIEPGTAERNALFRETSIPLASDLVERLFSEQKVARSSVTHLITITCTGFFNPGLDCHIIKNAALPKSIQRYQLGFMGCYAALSGLDMARQFCAADPDAVVLLISLELCSLHLQPNGGRDAILANALFADGAAACLISAREPDGPRFRLGPRATDLMTEGEQEMAWNIGDFGFDMVLSSYVPKLLGSTIEPLVTDALKRWDCRLADITRWAIHPGGKAIIDEVQKALQLNDEQVRSSRSVLQQFGNMSSATILFVLADLVKQVSGQERMVAMAFGPGLTIELFLLDAMGD